MVQGRKLNAKKSRSPEKGRWRPRKKASATPSSPKKKKPTLHPVIRPRPVLPRLLNENNETLTTLNTSAIVSALSLTSPSSTLKLERHPERLFKAAYATYEARRLDEIAQEHPGLRKQQRMEI